MIKRKQIKKRGEDSEIAKCGLCGNSGDLVKTACCEQWICADEDQNVLVTYAINNCYRNHRSYTLCGFHYAASHSGDWQHCTVCEQALETEMYLYYGTNEYNFEKLENPPVYEPPRCATCKAVINLGEQGFSIKGENYYCSNCTDF